MNSILIFFNNKSKINFAMAHNEDMEHCLLNSIPMLLQCEQIHIAFTGF